MLLLTKVTVTYSEVEDRICMSAQLHEGEPVVFWLTLRLCRLLVKALTAHLERSVAGSALVDTGLLLTCRQRDAEWQHEPSEPVRYSAGSRVIVPERVDLSCTVESAALLLPVGEGDIAHLPLNLQELRQWLAIIYRQFQLAGWPLDVWPEWFIPTEPALGRN